MLLGTILGAKKYVLPTSPTLMARVMEKVTNVKAVLLLYWPTLCLKLLRHIHLSAAPLSEVRCPPPESRYWFRKMVVWCCGCWCSFGNQLQSPPRWPSQNTYFLASLWGFLCAGRNRREEAAKVLNPVRQLVPAARALPIAILKRIIKLGAMVALDTGNSVLLCQAGNSNRRNYLPWLLLNRSRFVVLLCWAAPARCRRLSAES